MNLSGFTSGSRIICKFFCSYARQSDGNGKTVHAFFTSSEPTGRLMFQIEIRYKTKNIGLDPVLKKKAKNQRARCRNTSRTLINNPDHELLVWTPCLGSLFTHYKPCTEQGPILGTHGGFKVGAHTSNLSYQACGRFLASILYTVRSFPQEDIPSSTLQTHINKWGIPQGLCVVEAPLPRAAASPWHLWSCPPPAGGAVFDSKLTETRERF